LAVSSSERFPCSARLARSSIIEAKTASAFNSLLMVSNIENFVRRLCCLLIFRKCGFSLLCISVTAFFKTLSLSGDTEDTYSSINSVHENFVLKCLRLYTQKLCLKKPILLKCKKEQKIFCFLPPGMRL